MNEPLPPFPSTPGLRDFPFGLSLPLHALRLLFRNTPLRWLAFTCAAVTLLALGLVVAGLLRYTGEWVSWAFFPRPDEGWRRWLWGALWVGTFLFVGALGAQTVPLLLLAPLQDALSEATEAALGRPALGPQTWRDRVWGAWLCVTHTAARIALLLGGHALLLPLHFLPGLGSLLWTVGATLWTIFWLAAEYLDTAMARHLYRFPEVVQAVRARPGVSAGFGLGVYVLLWVPVLNLFFMPVAVVAGTLLFCGLRATGAVSAPSGTDTGRPRL